MVSTWSQTLLLSCLVLLLTTPWSSGFEYSGYCRKMCMWGRGGNLCKCSAVHFAGKRQLPSPSAAFADSAPGRAAEDADDVDEETLEGPTGDLDAARSRLVERLLSLLGKARPTGDKDSFAVPQLQSKDHLERLISLLLRKTSDSP